MNQAARQTIAEILRTLFLFENLDSAQSAKLAESCEIVSVERNAVLFREGEKAIAFFSLLSGRVKIYKLAPDGNEHVLEIHEPPNLVAEAAIFDRETYPAYCQALVPTRLLRIPRKAFVDLIMESPAVALKIMHAYSRRLRTFVHIIEGISLHDIKSRLALYLLSNSRPQQSHVVCQLLIPKKELAASLGTIPETLSRTLRFFKQKGIISEQGSLITITNPKLLQTFVK